MPETSSSSLDKLPSDGMDISSLQAAISRLESKFNTSNEQIGELRVEVGLLRQENSELRVTVSQQKAEISQQKAEISQQKAEISQQKAEISQQKAEISQQKAEISQQKAEISQQKAEISQQKAEISQQKAEIKILHRKNTKLAAENTRLKSENVDLRTELRKARGSNPSERNRGQEPETNLDDSSTNGNGSGGDDNGGDNPNGQDPNRKLSNKELYDAGCLEYKDKKLARRHLEFTLGRTRIMSEREWHEKQGSDPAFIPVAERQMDSPIAIIEEREQLPMKLSEAEKINSFGKSSGLSTAMNSVTRRGFHLVRTIETEKYQVVTDRNVFNEDGEYVSKSVAAGRGELGPENHQVTWEGLANTLLMITAFAIPMERIGHMLGDSYFNASNISRWVRQVAWHLLPIYLYLFRQTGEAKVVQMDDTGLYVEEMSKALASQKLRADCDMSGEEWESYLSKVRLDASRKRLDPMMAEVFDEMGRVSPYRHTTEGKASYHLSCLSWATDLDDTRSTVLFFRTHFGSCANLLSRGLENRSASNTDPLFIIADAGSENSLDPAIENKIEVFEQGCYHHARRKVKEFESLDIELASYLLERFRRLDELEWEAFLAPVTREGVQKAREAAGKIWVEIKEVASSVIAEKQHPDARNFLWKKGTSPNKGCAYIIKHYPELTKYLTNERLKGHNTFVERAFRPIKRMMDAVHNRKTEECQIALDVIRTIASTAECAGLDLKTFLKETMNTPRDEISADPGLYTPFCKSKNI